MGEATAQLGEEITQIKKELTSPKIISKKTDQEGRDKLASQIVDIRKDKSEASKKIGETAEEYTKRQESLVVKLKSKLNKIDQKSVEIWEKHLEAVDEKKQLPDPKELIEAYYEKKSTEPLTNEEKRELLKPEVLSQLTTDEYIALWKRLNPYFLTHVTRQGFRDHNAMFYHSAGLQEYHNGFVSVVKDEKKLRPPLALAGLKNRDEVSVKMFLSEWVLQAENEEEATERFTNLMNWHLASAPKYPDQTAVHFANQLVADNYYGGEQDNEVFFVFPSDVIASQHNFAFNGWEKDFTKPQSETKWNDIFIWPNSLENPGITIDAGVVFLPEKTQVDPKTGSKYASEAKQIDSVEKRVMIEDIERVNKFIDWAQSLNDQSEIIKMARDYYQERNYNMTKAKEDSLTTACLEELKKLGFSEESARSLSSGLIRDLMYWNTETPIDKFQDLIDGSSAKYKGAENTISSKEYWEKYFGENPQLKPKHIIYYDGDPSSAIYKFQQENDIGRANTSETDGNLLGFDDHFVSEMEKDPRANVGRKELVNMGNKIIREHYAFVNVG